jgi:hypothetical protein
MAIGNAVQRGGFVTIYNEKGIQIATVGVPSSSPDDGLKGYTSSRVNIKFGGFIHSYDERGINVGTTPA